MSTFAPFGTVLDKYNNSYKAIMEYGYKQTGSFNGITFNCIETDNTYIYVAYSTSIVGLPIYPTNKHEIFYTISYDCVSKK